MFRDKKDCSLSSSEGFRFLIRHQMEIFRKFCTDKIENCTENQVDFNFY